MFWRECHIRISLVVLQLLTAVLFSFSQSPITISRKIEKLYSGTGYLVTLKIQKKGIEGFAKIKEIPSDARFRAEATPGSAGVFSITNSEIRLLFTSLPAKDTFSVSYRLYCSNPLSLKGSFIFIENSEKKEVSTTGDENISATNTAVVFEKETTNEKNSGMKNLLPVFDTTKMKQRVVPAGASGEYFVSVTCSKLQLKSYAKIAYHINNGSILEVIENGSSSPSIVNGDAKFIWLTFPSNGEIMIKFKVNVKLPPEKPALEGVFYFVEENEKKGYRIQQ